MKQPAMTHDERCAGRKADYLVYYRVNSKLFYQAVWASSMIEAIAFIRNAVTNASAIRPLVRAPGRAFVL